MTTNYIFGYSRYNNNFKQYLWNYTEFTGAHKTIYVRTGDSVILFCNVTPNSWPVWDGPGVNKDRFITYSDRYVIDQNLPNAENLIIIGNISTGKYDLQIFNTSLNEEGLYRCSEFTKEAQLLQRFVELKIKGIYFKQLIIVFEKK